MNKKVVGLFCFDGPLYKDKNGIYCNVTLTNEMFLRFFCVVDELVLAIRTYILDKTYEEANMKPLKLDNISVIEVPNFNSARGMLVEKKKFKNYINGILENIDLVFCRMPSTTSDTIISVVRKRKMPYLVEVGGCAWDAFWNHGLMGKIVAPYMYYNEKRNVHNADFATYVTQVFLQNRYPNNGITECCSNVYINDVDETVLHERLKKIDCIGNKKIILGQAVNSIDVKYKGEDVVLKLMKKLHKQGIETEFQIVGPGNGEYVKKVANKLGITDKLKIMGTMKKDEIINWYRTIDIYIQPSKQEGLPRSVIEAMSQGVPCLGSNVAGIPELLDESCLLHLNDFKQMIEAIENLINEDNLKKQAIRNFKIAKCYDIDLIEARRKKILIQYYKSVISSQ